MTRAVVRVIIRWIPMPGSVVPEANVNPPGSIVAGHEPPNVRVKVPSRLYEDVVHAFDDAVPVNPDVVAVAVGPIAVNPNRPRTLDLGLDDHDGLRSRRRVFGCRDGLGLLNDDHRLAFDLLRGAVLGFDHHVRCRVGRCAGLPFSLVAVVRNIEPRFGRLAIAVCALVISRHRSGDQHRSSECKKRRESNKEIHGSSLTCMPVWACRHPPNVARAPPARQTA
jgi:hypothetical protein